jgi:transcription antitermination protein NusB
VGRRDQRRAAVFALYQADVTGRPPTAQLGRSSSSFTRTLVEGVERHRPELDGLIESHASGWSLDRIAPLERNILRVALYELLHSEDIPTEVAIDEAVEAAKELCSAEAPGFLNGILGAVARERVAS